MAQMRWATYNRLRQADTALSCWQCGKCYRLQYGARTIYILAVDHTDKGFNIAKAAMDDLTNGQAYQLGRIEAQTEEVVLSNCGL